MRKIKISPSILSADFSCLRESIEAVKDAEMLHLDVMDGHFVPNITVGPCVIGSLRELSDHTFDAHLMISDPGDYIGDFAECGSDIITFHAEACSDIEEIIDLAERIRREGIRAGLSLNPETSFESVIDALEHIDLLLIMTVNPGFSGQGFKYDVVPKIERARRYIDDNDHSVKISVDGGVSQDTAPLVVKAGAEILAAGSAIFSGDPTSNLEDLRKAAEDSLP